MELRIQEKKRRKAGKYEVLWAALEQFPNESISVPLADLGGSSPLLKQGTILALGRYYGFHLATKVVGDCMRIWIKKEAPQEEVAAASTAEVAQ